MPSENSALIVLETYYLFPSSSEHTSAVALFAVSFPFSFFFYVSVSLTYTRLSNSDSSLLTDHFSRWVFCQILLIFLTSKFWSAVWFSCLDLFSSMHIYSFVDFYDPCNCWLPNFKSLVWLVLWIPGLYTQLFTQYLPLVWWTICLNMCRLNSWFPFTNFFFSPVFPLSITAHLCI